MKHISLIEAFGLSPTCRAAVVGSGGKTSLLFRLARAMKPPVVVSNSAHLAVEQGQFADRVITVSGLADLPLGGGDAFEEVTLVTGPADARGRTQGLSRTLLDGVLKLADAWGAPLLIEADGSRGLPLKAPADWEPPIPDFVDTVIVTTGMSGLGKRLTGEWVYQPEDFGKLAGLELELPISLQAAASVLLHPQGGLKNIPAQARRIALLNQADSVDLRDQAAKLAQLLMDGYQRVVVGSLHGPGGDGPQAEIHAVFQKTAGIILAAGAGRRMGQPKQLLEWQGEALVRKQAHAAQEAGLDPIILVVGAHAAEVQAATRDLKLRVVNNEAWSEGQSSSVKAGLTAVPAENGAAVFLLADQPFISAEVVRHLVTYHAQTLAAVVAPRVGGQRANPVLFDRRTFAGLAALQGDTGGRQVMGQWGVDLLDWPDKRLLLDIDNLDDYQRAIDQI